MYNFLCDVRCACNESKEYKHVLVFTSFFLTIPAFLLLQEGWYILGIGTLVLFVTSTIYHSIHKSWIRALDVIMVHIVGGGAALYASIKTIMSPSSTTPLPFCVALISFIAINIINLCPRWSHEHAPCGLVIKLPYHACVHMLTAVVLTSLAIGFHFN